MSIDFNDELNYITVFTLLHYITEIDHWYRITSLFALHPLVLASNTGNTNIDRL